jgi:hypothetical protein
MYDKGVITIANNRKGVADSPLLGFTSINNCEVFEDPGVIKIGTKAELYFTPNALPVKRVVAPNGDVYILTNDVSSSALYKNGVAVQSNLENAQDMVFYEDYIVVSYDTDRTSANTGALGLYGPLTNAPQFFGNWKTLALDDDAFKKLVVCQDGLLYVLNNTEVVKVSAFSGGTPAVSPTATATSSGWTFPNSQEGSTMIEYGRNLVMGTTSGNVYQWDRSDTQLTDVPFTLSSGGIKQMLVKENLLYITAGNKGEVYRGDGTNFQKVQQVKWRQRRPYNANTLLKPNAISLSPTGTLLVGTSTGSDSFPGTSKHGVHEISLSTGFPTVFKHRLSTTNTGTSSAITIGFIQSDANDIYIGWQDGSSFGVDKVSYNLTGSYGASFETPLMQIAGKQTKKSFTNLEFQLQSPLASGQSIRVSKRGDATSDYDTAREYTYTALGAVTSHTAEALMSDIENLMVKVDLTDSSSVVGENVELINIRIW